MTTKKVYHPIVENLVSLINKNKWSEKFDKAIKKAHSKKVPFLEHVNDLDGYLDWINKFLYWVPTEIPAGDNISDHFGAFYFIASQEPVFALQNKIVPHNNAQLLTPFSQWLVDYANAVALFLDTPASLTSESEQTYYESPRYNMNEYIRPHGGWKSFNQLFARNFKPGFRPIAAIVDTSIIVSPADSVFVGQWEIRKDSNITVKNLNWKISELLEGSPYKDHFTNGLFMHAFLSPTDYHRMHAPVGGRVLEARVIHGQVFLEITAKLLNKESGKHTLTQNRIYDIADNTGYQFAQSRGLIVLDTPIGLVAVLPIGMCQVSSVVLTAEVGVTVRKGEELSYFQFGGSDIILLFASSSNVSITAQPGVHYKMGTRIAQAYPAM